MRRVWSKLLLLGALVVLAPACGAPSHERSTTLQASLRALADDAPVGDHAYWLGPEFQRAPVRFADASWARFAILTYNREQDVDVDVESFRGHALDVGKGFPVRVRTAIGQDVVLLFHTPRRPGAALVRSAKAALRPIPAGVIYPG
jgi:hypothetical protein